TMSSSMAEAEGFEPSRELPPYTLSRRVPSTPPPSLPGGVFRWGRGVAGGAEGGEHGGAGVGRGLELVEDLGGLGEEVVGGGTVTGATGRGRLEGEGTAQPDGQAQLPPVAGGAGEGGRRLGLLPGGQGGQAAGLRPDRPGLRLHPRGGGRGGAPPP